MALNLADFHRDDTRLYIAQGKFHKACWVPLSTSTAGALAVRGSAPANKAPLSGLAAVLESAWLPLAPLHGQSMLPWLDANNAASPKLRALYLPARPASHLRGSQAAGMVPGWVRYQRQVSAAGHLYGPCEYPLYPSLLPAPRLNYSNRSIAAFTSITYNILQLKEALHDACTRRLHETVLQSLSAHTKGLVDQHHRLLSRCH